MLRKSKDEKIIDDIVHELSKDIDESFKPEKQNTTLAEADDDDNLYSDAQNDLGKNKPKYHDSAYQRRL